MILSLFKTREEKWNNIYENIPLAQIPWHTEKPEKELIKLVEQGAINPCKVLDMCSGAATNSIYLASKGFEVYGIDISPKAANIANERCRKKGLACKYYAGDIFKQKFNSKFDFIFDRGCFHHMGKKDKLAYIGMLREILSPRGSFFLQCFSDKNEGFWKNLSKQCLKNYFSKHFDIKYIKDTIHIESDSGQERYLYSVFMTKK